MDDALGVAAGTLEDRCGPVLSSAGKGDGEWSRDWGAAHGGKRLSIKQLGTMNYRALFILDKLIKRDMPKFQAAWAIAFPGRLMNDPSQIQPDEVTRGPWLVILTRMGATPGGDD